VRKKKKEIARRPARVLVGSKERHGKRGEGGTFEYRGGKKNKKKKEEGRRQAGDPIEKKREGKDEKNVLIRAGGGISFSEKKKWEKNHG